MPSTYVERGLLASGNAAGKRCVVKAPARLRPRLPRAYRQLRYGSMMLNLPAPSSSVNTRHSLSSSAASPVTRIAWEMASGEPVVVAAFHRFHLLGEVALAQLKGRRQVAVAPRAAFALEPSCSSASAHSWRAAVFCGSANTRMFVICATHWYSPWSKSSLARCSMAFASPR